MSRILVFQHSDECGPGRLGRVLAEHGRRLVIVRPDREGAGVVPRDLHDIEGVVSLGGPMNISDGIDWLHAEIAFLKRAHEASIPMVGICLGHQAIATAARRCGGGDGQARGRVLADRPLARGPERPGLRRHAVECAAVQFARLRGDRPAPGGGAAGFVGGVQGPVVPGGPADVCVPVPLRVDPRADRQRRRGVPPPGRRDAAGDRRAVRPALRAVRRDRDAAVPEPGAPAVAVNRSSQTAKSPKRQRRACTDRRARR
ncbi:MAG: hypothetical protein HND58_16485 [Planctomycetota bacterium]|nr:MAG: hypothetical protein HND58_16485 [Planctomycetota bacterium]